MKIVSTYEQILQRLRLKIQTGKINVCFYVNEPQKWQSELLFKQFKQSNDFNVSFVFYPNPESVAVDKDFEYFRNKGVKVYFALQTKPDDFDIIFYQQPWLICKHWKLSNTSLSSLTCYVPYCVYSLYSNLNCINNFHPLLWKQFTDFSNHLSINNQIFLGSLKMQEFLLYLKHKTAVNDKKNNSICTSSFFFKEFS